MWGGGRGRGRDFFIAAVTSVGYRSILVKERLLQDAPVLAHGGT